MIFCCFFPAAHWTYWVFLLAHFCWWPTFINWTALRLRLASFLRYLFLNDVYRNSFFDLLLRIYILIWLYQFFWIIVFLYIIWYYNIFGNCCRSQLIQLMFELAYIFFFFEVFLDLWFIVWSWNKVIKSSFFIQCLNLRLL